MSPSDIVNVTEANFEYEVIDYSKNIPVVVDFWAEWCIPCKTLDPILRELAQKSAGSFRLARLNVDENKKIAAHYNVRSIPAVKAFRDGHVIAEFTGLKSGDEIQRFLRHVVPSQADLQLDKGLSMLSVENWQEAEHAFDKVLQELSDHPSALLGLAKSLLAQGEGKQALEILDHFPSSSDFSSAEKLISLATALVRMDENPPEPSTAIETTYQHALRLVKLGNLPAAMDGILAVLRQDKQYRDDEARQVMLGFFEILGNKNPTTRQYRDELASILF
jgi:putative thioredoxin